MSWCEPCSRFYDPEAITVEGVCPQCGEVLTEDHQHALALSQAETAPRGAPWHFWLMVAALTLYLAWRVVQGFIALF